MTFLECINSIIREIACINSPAAHRSALSSNTTNPLYLTPAASRRLIERAPFLGQGLNQAVQDAYVLCKELVEVNQMYHATPAELDAAILR